MPSLKSRFCLFLIVFAIGSACQISQAQSPGAKAKPTGSISGHVLIDGKAVAGVPVAAVAGTTVNRRDSSARAITDNEGFYLLSNLGPGQYQIWTLTPGFVADPGSSPNSMPYSGAIKTINLNLNEAVANIDLKLIRGSVITGRVTAADNKPVVKQRLRLELLDERGNPRDGAIGSAFEEMYQTDDRGVYRIYGLLPGRYRVSVGFDPNNESAAYPEPYRKTFYPDPADESKPGVVELKEGYEATNIDIKVKDATPRYSVAGRVVDGESGLPAARAGVRLVPAMKNAMTSGGILLQADDRGEFTFSGFSPGRYSVSATAEYYGGNYYSDPVYFDVADKDVTGLEVKTIAGLSVSGVVVAESMSTNELLTLLPGLTVSVGGSLASDQQVRAWGHAAVSPDGSFEVDGLRPGLVSLEAFVQRPPFGRPRMVRVEHDGVPLGARSICGNQCRESALSLITARE